MVSNFSAGYQSLQIPHQRTSEAVFEAKYLKEKKQGKRNKPLYKDFRRFVSYEARNIQDMVK